MWRLLQTKNIMVSGAIKKGAFISILNVIQGDVDPTSVHKSLQRIWEWKLANFIPWGPASIQVALSKKSPYIDTVHKVSGLMIANHTGIWTLFQTVLEHYKQLRKKDAFLQQYKETKVFEENLDEFDLAAETVKNLVNEYAASEKSNYNYGSEDQDMPFEGH